MTPQREGEGEETDDKKEDGRGSGRASAVTCGGKRGERELPLNYAGLLSVPKTNQPDGEGQGPPSPPLSPHCTSARCIKRSVGTLPQGSGLPPPTGVRPPPPTPTLWSASPGSRTK